MIGPNAYEYTHLDLGGERKRGGNLKGRRNRTVLDQILNFSVHPPTPSAGGGAGGGGGADARVAAGRVICSGGGGAVQQTPKRAVGPEDLKRFLIGLVMLTSQTSFLTLR